MSGAPLGTGARGGSAPPATESRQRRTPFVPGRAGAASVTQNATAWLQALGEQPRDRWLSFLVLVLESGVLQSGALLPQALLLNLAQAPQEVYERWVYVTLDGLRRVINPRYLAAGIHFACEYAPDETFTRVWAAPDFDEKTANELERLLPVEWAGRELMDLWETCAALPGFSSYVRDTNWARFTPAQRRYLLRFFMFMRWDQDGPFDQERWRAIAAHIPRLERRRRGSGGVHRPVPQRRRCCVSGMERPAEILARLPLFIDLLARVNRPPFNPDGDAALVVGNLLRLPDAHHGLHSRGDGRFFLALDKAVAGPMLRP